jgi:hypothetical protein
MNAYVGKACSRHGGVKCVPLDIGTREGKWRHGSPKHRREDDMGLEEMSVWGGGLEASVSGQRPPWLSFVKMASKRRGISAAQRLTVWRTVLCTWFANYDGSFDWQLVGRCHVSCDYIEVSLLLVWDGDRCFLVVTSAAVLQTEARVGPFQ